MAVVDRAEMRSIRASEMGAVDAGIAAHQLTKRSLSITLYRSLPGIQKLSIMKPNKSDTGQDILRLSMPLFAERGFDGVSMREIAQAAGITPAALYYHFKSKDHLYGEVLDFCFKDKVENQMLADLPDGNDPWARLEHLVGKWTELLTKEKEFHRLIQRVYLDSDAERQALVGKRVLGGFYEAIRKTVAQIAPPHFDEHQLALSLVGLVSYPFQTTFVRKSLPGYRAKNETSKYLTQHILTLLRDGINAKQKKAGNARRK